MNFNEIRGYSGGQRQAFEELVCQLARREPMPPGAGFRRIEGSGGDGGVEAYWVLPDGSKVGYQAKFFTRTRDINWRQIDKSVEQALQIHSTLKEYIIALPCDLNGSARVSRKGWDRLGDLGC